MATKTWTGVSSSDWFTVSNWTGGLPTAGDDAILNAGGAVANAPIHALSVTVTTANLQLENASAGSMVGGGFSLFSGQLYVDYNFANGGSQLAITGALGATNSSVYIGNGGLSAATTVSAASLSAAGSSFTIVGSVANNALAKLAITGAAGTGTAGHLTGTYSLTGEALLQFGSGQITNIDNGSALSLNGAHARVALAAAPTTNSALSGLTTNDGALNLDNGASVTTTAGLANNGSIYIDYYNGYFGGGSTLSIGGTFANNSYTYIGNDNLGTDSTLAAAALNSASSSTTEIHGSVANNASAKLLVSGAAGTGTTGHLTGYYNLHGQALLQFASGQITTIDANSGLWLDGAQARVALAANPATNSALTGLTTNDGYLYLDRGASVTTTGGLTNNGNVYIDYQYGYLAGGSTLAVGGAYANNNYTYVGNDNLATDATLSATALNSAAGSTTEIHGSVANNATGKVIVSGAAGTGTTGHISGYYNLHGQALLQFGSGQITAIDASSGLWLDGAQARVALAANPATNSALTGLTINDGYLYLDRGASVTTTGGLTNNGNVYIDYQYGYLAGGSTLAVGGAYANNNYTYVGNDSLATDATLSATALNSAAGSTTEIHGSVANNATGKVIVSGAAGTGTTGHLTGYYNLHGQALLQFASGQITTIDANSGLWLDGAQARVALAANPATNSALTGLTTNDGYLYLDRGASVTTTGGLTNNGNVYIDYQYGYLAGGSTLAVGGAYANNNYTYVGNDSLATDATLSATALNSAAGSTTEIHGSVANNATGKLIVSGVAGTGATGHLTGYYNLHGQALLRFASGQITTIDANSGLWLDGAQARVALASSPTTNSALTGLTTNEGYLDLDRGASVATTGGLTNNSNVYIDYFNGYFAGGSTLAVGGTYTNNNYTYVGNDNLLTDATLSATALNSAAGSTTEIHGNVANNATGKLIVSGAAGTGTAGHLTGYYNLHGQALLQFASGQITTIDANSGLWLDGVHARVALAASPATNSALTGLTHNAGNLTLTNGASLATTGDLDSFNLTVDNTYGSNVASTFHVGGVLAIQNSAFIGNAYGPDMPATTVTAAALVVNGGLTIRDNHNWTSNTEVPTDLVVTGDALNDGHIDIDVLSKISVGGDFVQDRSAILELRYDNFGNLGRIDVDGSVNIDGGNIYLTSIYSAGPTVGQVLTAMTFAPGELTGMFDSFYGSYVGSGNGVYAPDIGYGVAVGVLYNDQAGNIQIVTIASPSTTADSWVGSSGSWTDAAHWNHGVPTFYSDVAIGGATATLSQDATINSLTISNTGALLTGATAGLFIGGGLVVAGDLEASGKLFVGGATVTTGHVQADGPIAQFRGAVSGSGFIDVGDGATVDFRAGVAAATTVAFDGQVNATADKIVIESAADFAGSVSNFQTDDVINFAKLVVTSVQLSGSSDLLLKDGNGDTISTLHFAGDYSAATFSVTGDGAGGTNLTINAAPVNHAPVAVADTGYTVGEDGQLVVGPSGVLGNDSDADSDPLTAVLGTGPSHGTLALNANGSFTYTPFANYNGADSFTYHAYDGQADSNTVTVSLTVNPVNDNPTANADSLNTAYQTALVIPATDLSANDSDIDGDTVTVTGVSGATHGTVSLNSGTVTFTPDTGYYGTTSFNYAISDGHGGTANGVAYVTVAPPPNFDPVAVADSYSTSEDTQLIVPATGVLSNDTDQDGDALTAVLNSGPAHGSLTLNANGSFTYTPVADYHGADSFTYYANDGQANSNVVTVSFTVNSVPDAPIANADGYATNEDTPLVIAAAAGVLSNDTDGDGDALTAVLNSGPAHGSLTLNANGSFTYTPDANYHGADSFTYHANDGSLNSGVVTVSLSVNSVNDDPVANNDSGFATPYQTNLVISAATLLANDSDIDGDTLSITGVGGATHGSISYASGQATFTPDAGYSGPASFTYAISDNNGGTSTATVSLTVGTPSNHAPTANADNYATNEDTQLIVAATGVLANDSDQDGDALTAVLNSGPAHGSLTLNANGSFTYTPDANYHGADSFTYHANDGSLNSAPPVTVSLTVNPINDAPSASADGYATNEDTPLVIAAAGVLSNDSDIDGDALSAVLSRSPAHGSLTLNANGSFTYTPDANYHGSDSFTYRASDGSLDSAPVTVSLTVNPINDAPSASADSYATNEDTPLVIAAAGVLWNDSDIDGDALTAVLNSSPAHGSLTLNANGSFTYTPDANYHGADSFTYHANDGTADSAAVTVSLTVNSINDAPSATADNYATDQDTALVIAAAGVLTNDTDIDGDPLTAVLNSGPSHGSLTLNANGSFTYIPDAGYHGADSFSYRANDGATDSNVVTVALTINAAGNHTPIATGDSYATNEDTQLVIAAAGVLSNDSDQDGNALTAVLNNGPAHGSLTLGADGSFVYTPDANYHGADSFTYHANDGATDSGVVTVSLTVNSVNDAPTATANSYATNQNTALVIVAAGVLSNDSDVDGDPLTAVLNSGPAHGSLTLNANGSFTYTPDANYHGADSFTYHANDGAADSAPVTVSLTVNPVSSANHNPVANGESYAVATNSMLTIPVSALLQNDSDADGDALSILSVDSASHGSVQLVGGNVLFMPDANYKGTAGFSYTIDDGHGGTAIAAVFATVTPGYVYGGGSVSGLALDYSYDAANHLVSGSGQSDTLRGGEGADSFNGGAGDDFLFGGLGKDSLTGGAGADVVTGGGGQDVFIFNRADFADPALTGGKLDMIMDFEGAGDGYKSGFGDLVRFQGFSAASTLSHVGDVAAHPEQHIYEVRDGAFQAQFIIQYSGAGTDLLKGDYGFYL